ncbi:MAG: signal peptide peptidase SppA [Pseudoflavonifractor sp.]|nr:signal peptide peptidase SppA [Pseudoflavonifractor sp.]
MLKNFFSAFLGSMAALWLTIILGSILSAVMMIVMMAGVSNMSQSVNLRDKSILYLDLSGSITERRTPVRLIDEIYNQGSASMPLDEVLRAIRRAADDSKIKGIYIDCNGAASGLATADAIVNALRKFRESGKWIVAYGDNISQGNYYIAATADSLYVNPAGSVDIHGIAAMTLFYKNLLDKLGIEMQVIKVGTFKSAVEPFMLTEMSEANRLQQETYINNIWGYMSGRIAAMRGVSEAEVNNWADNLIMTQSPDTYAARHIVDGLKYRHEVEETLAGLTDTEVDKLRLVTPSEYCSATNTRSSGGHKIAVLYAEGDIVDTGSDGIVGERMVPLILLLSEDDELEGMVLRVNSGGGSAFASEQIWEALEQFKDSGKKLYVSMGDYAASGGYYISCGADRIYAEPVTLTGSIGIFGLIPNAEGLLSDHLGVTSGTVSSNENAAFMSVIRPMTPMQREAMQSYVNRGYETFVGRCAAGRDMPVDSIKAIAEGRVWDGMEALRLNLVDQLGGMDMAITDMGEELGGGKITITEYPELKPDWWDEIVNVRTVMTERDIKSQLGVLYPYYRESRRILETNPIQCRMQPVVID